MRRNRWPRRPAGLNMNDAVVGPKVGDALTQPLNTVRAAGFALDATLGRVRRPLITDKAIALHGGDETVRFDSRGPVARAVLTYGQSTDPASPLATKQLRLFSQKQWPVLPFHADDVAKARVGDVLKRVRP